MMEKTMQTESAIVKSKSSLLLLSALMLLFASFFTTELVSFSKGHVMICHLPCEAAPSFRFLAAFRQKAFLNRVAPAFLLYKAAPPH